MAHSTGACLTNVGSVKTARVGVTPVGRVSVIVTPVRSVGFAPTLLTSTVRFPPLTGEMFVGEVNVRICQPGPEFTASAGDAVVVSAAKATRAATAAFATTKPDGLRLTSIYLALPILCLEVWLFVAPTVGGP